VVDELIKENGRSKRQLDRLATKAAGATSGNIERGLRSIERRVERALSGRGKFVGSGMLTLHGRRRSGQLAKSNKPGRRSGEVGSDLPN